MAARKVSTAMFRMPFRREEEELGPGWLLVWALPYPQVTPMSPYRTSLSLHCCKFWQQITGEHRLSKRIISPLSGLSRERLHSCFPPNILDVMYGRFNEITDASWQIQPTRLINLEDPELSAAREREEHQCRNINEKDLLKEMEKAGPYMMGEGKVGNLKWILKQFVWFCLVDGTLERSFPSVPFSPWPVLASLSRLSSC